MFEVYQERAEQLKLKKHLMEAWKKKNQWWHETMLEEIKNTNLIEETKKKQQHEKMIQLGIERKKQVFDRMLVSVLM